MRKYWLGALGLVALGTGAFKATLVPGLTIMTAPDSVQAGRTATMTARAVNWKGNIDQGASPLWRSTNSGVLTVLGSGLTATVTGRTAGTACAIASWTNRQRFYADTACVRVSAAATYTYTLVGPGADTLGWDATRTYQVKAYVKGGQFTTLSRIADPSIVFTSSNPDVATVTDVDSGRVTVKGMNPGPAYVVSSYRGVVDSMPVMILRNVERLEIKGPNGEAHGVTITPGQTVQLYAVMWDIKGQVLDVYPSDVPVGFPYVPVGRRKDARYYQPPAVRIALAEWALQHSNFKVSVR